MTQAPVGALARELPTEHARKLLLAGALAAATLFLALGALARSPAAPPAPTTAEDTARAAYAKLPPSFVPNRGQADPHVRYSAQGAGFAFAFSERQALLSFTKGERGHALALRFVGANPDPTLVATDRRAGKVNYLTGSDRSAWHTGLPTYATLTYRELWPGIDMVFRGQGGRLKYEFHLRPGARASDIRLAYAGAEGLSLGAGGALLIDTSLGALRDSRPQSFQRRDGRRIAVDSRYALAGSSYGFALGRYDQSRPLVIDPGLVYSTFLGGGSSDDGLGIAVDGSGRAYVTGRTQSPNFPTTPGAFDTTHNGLDDAFVTKLNSSGSALSYSTFLGGTAVDRAFGIAVDGSGRAHVTGRTGSPNFPTTPGAFDTTHNGLNDAFVTKLNSSGSALSYSTFLGGATFDQGLGIAVDRDGRAHVTGNTDSTNFPTTPGAFDTTHNGSDDAFVTKLNSSGSALSYSTFLGGTSTDFGSGIAVDGSGRAYVTGFTGSPNFPTTPGAFDTTHNGLDDAFVTKLNTSGSALSYSTFLGGTLSDIGFGIAVDRDGRAYVTGDTGSPNFPTTPGAFDTTHNGSTDAFVTRLNASGSALSYSTFLGGTSFDGANAIAVDRDGRAHVNGFTDSPNFPTTAGAFDTTHNGLDDAFVTKLNSSGSALSYSTFLGGTSADRGDGIAVDGSGRAYVTGTTGSPNFPTTPGAFDTTHNGTADAFVTKLDLVPACPSEGDDDGDDDGLDDADERTFLTLLGNADSDKDGVKDGNDDADGDGEDDEDEDDESECPDDQDGDGTDDEDEDDEDD